MSRERQHFVIRILKSKFLFHLIHIFLFTQSGNGCSSLFLFNFSQFLFSNFKGEYYIKRLDLLIKIES